MENNIFDLIIETFVNGDNINLIRGGHYEFIGEAETKVNGIPHHNAIHYRISATETKRITRQFIELTYQFYLENNFEFPNVNWYLDNNELMHEYISRRCNKSVARSFILRVQL